MVLQASVVLSSSRTKLGIVERVILIIQKAECVLYLRSENLADFLCISEGHEVVSSLPLQMALYFNVLFFPVWFLSEVIMLELKYHLLPGYYQFLLITAVTILTLIESLRLYLGYIGNLHEKVPELAGFLLLTFLIQMPLILFLVTDERILILPLEYAVHTIYILFLKTELFVSFFVLKVMTRHLATQFYLQRTDLEDSPTKCSHVTIQRNSTCPANQKQWDAL